MDYCKYVDVFYGNGEVDHFVENGLASKWFYIKAICGNTTPHAVLPFGKMSVGAYSGGYPTGYGTHYPNSCAGIKKLSDKMAVRGFSHLHQSGTGGIKYYYNYAIVSPFYGELSNAFNYSVLDSEKAVPGLYTASYNDITASVTTTHDVAFHQYRFNKKGGRIAVDFSNDGLSRQFSKSFYNFVKDATVEIDSDNFIYFTGVLSGIKLYFSVKVDAKNVKIRLFENDIEVNEKSLVIKNPKNPFGAVIDFDGDVAFVKVSYSTINFLNAKNAILNVNSTFNEVSSKAYKIWNDYLSKIDVQSNDEEFKTKFYSNLYHSIIKPCDMTGEIVLGVSEAVVTDFATFWDQYKTALPLIYTLYSDVSKKIVDSIINVSKTLNKLPCSFGLTDIFPCEEQAKMLALLTLIDAYRLGVKNISVRDIEKVIETELNREDYKTFITNGVFERYTHIIDVTDACFAVADLTKDNGLKERLLSLASNWVNAYDNDGLMSQKSEYYEGDRYTYSFRLQYNILDRIKLAGGNDAFVKMLDDFFGFNKESLRQITEIDGYDEIYNSNYHRFEGFNNECDMETPYAYIYANRQDRTCDIVHACIEQSFALGRGGLPGNNDSGGLSSCFIWNALGVFPASGKGEFLLGSPHVNSATIKLSNGKILNIITENLSKENYHVESVSFNDKSITDYRLNMSEFMQGGTLKFKMKKATNNG